VTKLTLTHAVRFAALAFWAVASAAAAEPVLNPGPWIVVEDALGRYGYLAIDAARHRLLGAHVNDDTADIFDLDTNKLIARVEVGPVVGIAVDPKTGRYFASVQDDKRIAIIGGRALKETGSIALPGECDAILFDAKDRRIYITNDNGKTLWAVDPDAKKIVAAIPVAAEPGCMAHDAATDRIYLAGTATSQVSVIDTKTNSVVATWPTAPAAGPHGLALDAAHGRIFVAGDNGQLVAIDTKTGRIIASAPISEHVDQIAFDAEFRRVYCAGPDWITVVQATDAGLATLDKVYTATTAKNVAVDPKTHAVWSTFTDGEDSFAKSWIPN
jgi:DNA-binding beta-propeller fold protein YncE